MARNCPTCGKTIYSDTAVCPYCKHALSNNVKLADAQLNGKGYSTWNIKKVVVGVAITVGVILTLIFAIAIFEHFSNPIVGEWRGVYMYEYGVDDRVVPIFDEDALILQIKRNRTFNIFNSGENILKGTWEETDIKGYYDVIMTDGIQGIIQEASELDNADIDIILLLGRFSLGFKHK